MRREFHDSGYKVYNSFFILSDDKVQFYDKIKLVPFGEFIPFKNILNFLKLTPGSTDFSSGLKENNIKLNLMMILFLLNHLYVLNLFFRHLVLIK